MRGVIDGILADGSGRFGTIYAGQHGIFGALHERLVNVSKQDRREVDLLEVTPCAGAMGSCRYKLPRVDEDTLLEKVKGVDIESVNVGALDEQVQDYVRIMQVFNKHDIGYFFYAGGNDSMDTAYKVDKVAKALGMDVVATGVPKTIDNDVGDKERELVDHTPGYGSTAAYWNELIVNGNEENKGSCTSDPVLIWQVMGRKVGYLPAAARLADPERNLPLVIILTEMLENEKKADGPLSDAEQRALDAENEKIAQRNLKFIEDQIAERLKEHGRAMVVMSEGTFLGNLGLSRDAFGHAGYSTGIPVAARLTMQLNSDGGLLERMGIPGSARANVPGTDQRGFTMSVSGQDLLEAYESGRHAVKVALEGGGHMATIQRDRASNSYKPIYDMVPLNVVAAVDRSFPQDWVDRNNADVTDGFVDYARPLIRTGQIIRKNFDSLDKFLEERKRIKSDDPLAVVVPVIGGQRRVTQFDAIYADKTLDDYVPVGERQ
jgi:6-phosphofructokinase 1